MRGQQTHSEPAKKSAARANFARDDSVQHVETERRARSWTVHGAALVGPIVQSVATASRPTRKERWREGTEHVRGACKLRRQ